MALFFINTHRGFGKTYTTRGFFVYQPSGSGGGDALCGNSNLKLLIFLSSSRG